MYSTCIINMQCVAYGTYHIIVFTLKVYSSLHSTTIYSSYVSEVLFQTDGGVRCYMCVVYTRE